MSKHDFRITTTKYIISMIVAVIVSLASGIVSGYFIAQHRSQSKIQVEDPSKTEGVIQNSTLDTLNISGENLDAKDKIGIDKDTSKLEISKEQQSSISKSALNTFYSIDSKAYAKILSESNNNNSIVKEKLFSTYKGILAENSLNSIKKIIDAGSSNGYYFSDFYNGKRSTSIKNIEVYEYKDGILKVKSTITNTFVFYSIPNSSDFFGELKGTGINKDQYVSMVMEKPKRIEVLETRKDQFDLKYINGKWYIINDKTEIISTEILKVIFQNTTYSLDEFKIKFF